MPIDAQDARSIFDADVESLLTLTEGNESQLFKSVKGWVVMEQLLEGR